MRVTLIAVFAGAALLCAVPAQGAAKKTVTIGDNYFAPQTLKVKRGTTVTWRWPGFEEGGDVHDVKLGSGPKKAKKFQSEAASTDYSFPSASSPCRASTGSSARSTTRCA